MKTVFADADYWIGLLNKNDQLHTSAKEVSQSLGHVRIVTSQMVLAEVLNSFSKRGQHFREMVTKFVEALEKNPNVSIEPQTHQLFCDAFGCFKTRLDKDWSITDCASFIIMQRLEITEALSHDEHFQQAGYQALLRSA